MNNTHIESTSDFIALALFGDYRRIECTSISVALSIEQCYLLVKYRVILSNKNNQCFALKFNLDPFTHQPSEPLEVVELNSSPIE